MKGPKGRLPERLHVYENHLLDSPRWDRFETRPGDIVITTAYKSGTTWMQTIVANLIFQDGEIPGPIMEISPWIDMRIRRFDEIVRTTSAQTHRRFLKTHLPLDGIPFREDVRYIYVGRDLRDVFMSLWNHHRHMSEEAYRRINDPETLVGNPLPRCPDDIKELWDLWVRRGWFEWEREGYPFWSSSHHARTWWEFRYLPNILFVHFADLLSDPAKEIDRVARFIDVAVTPASLARVVEAVSFNRMKANADSVLGQAAAFWEGGARRFNNKGTNGRWRDLLDEEDLSAYRAMVDEVLSPTCARWLEQGRAALVGAAHP